MNSTMKHCDCGSGEPRYPVYDGHGIFLVYACHECEAQKLRRFRADILTPYQADEPIEEED